MRLYTVKINRTMEIECNDEGQARAIAESTVVNPKDWEFWLKCLDSEIPISKLNLPQVMVKDLQNLGITSVDELAQFTETELGWHYTFGHAALDELREKLRVLGFKFGR